MDQIECFTKFFLQQAGEIKPSTIQALIDEGYTTKLSLICIDLLHDLPLVELENLSQRSILRKYLAALQEHCPFTLRVQECEPASTAATHKVSKKRKIDSVQEDMETMTPNMERSESRGGGFSPFTSPISLAYNFQRDVLDQPVKPSFSSQPAFVPDNRISPIINLSETYESVLPDAKPVKPVKKARVPRSKSQVRFQQEKERQSLAAVPDQTMETSEAAGSSTLTKKVGASTANQIDVPTPAAQALLAKLEEKNKSGRKGRARK